MSTVDINLVLFILLPSRIFLTFMIVHVVFIFITPDAHTVWEIITPNDNERNMVKCEGLNLFRFQMSLV